MHYAGTRDPRAETNPLRSTPLFRPASALFGYTAEQQAEFAKSRAIELARHTLTSAEAGIAHARAAYVQARKDIGQANKGISRGILIRDRRLARSIAFRAFNGRLRELRAAEKRRAEAEAAFLSLVEA